MAGAATRLMAHGKQCIRPLYRFEGVLFVLLCTPLPVRGRDGAAINRPVNAADGRNAYLS